MHLFRAAIYLYELLYTDLCICVSVDLQSLVQVNTRSFVIYDVIKRKHFVSSPEQTVEQTDESPVIWDLSFHYDVTVIGSANGLYLHGPYSPLSPKPMLMNCQQVSFEIIHDEVIKWKHFPRYWPFLRWIHRSPGNSLHKGQWRGALMFSLICALNKRLSKQSSGWWFETRSRLL